MADPIVLFVARGDPEDANDAATQSHLNESLRSLASEYEAQVRSLGNRPPQYYTFYNRPSKIIPPAGDVMAFFVEFLEEGERQQDDIVLVINGWDGITSNKGSFRNIFRRCSNMTIDVRLAVYAETPPRFFDVNVSDVCAIFGADVDPEDEDADLEENSVLFAERLSLIFFEQMAALNPDMFDHTNQMVLPQFCSYCVDRPGFTHRW